jgi:hypothetical protein
MPVPAADGIALLETSLTLEPDVPTVLPISVPRSVERPYRIRCFIIVGQRRLASRLSAHYKKHDPAVAYPIGNGGAVMGDMCTEGDAPHVKFAKRRFGDPDAADRWWRST